jgi:polysaccharide biosynthesis protein PslH
MRILFLTETIPAPLDSGGRIKTFHTLGILASQHHVECHAFIRDRSQRAHGALLADRTAALTLHEHGRSVAGEARDLARAVLTRRPFTLVRHDVPAVHRTLAAAVRRGRFDVVYCDHLSMVQYGASLGRPMLYDAHNVEWALIARHAETERRLLAPLLRVEAERLREEERGALTDASLTLAVSEVDRRALLELSPSAQIRVIPIAVDVSAAPYRSAPAVTKDVVFVGGLHWPPNEAALDWFVAQVWPLVAQARPEARFFAVGRATPSQRERLETAPGVSVVGAVPDIEPWFARARALVVPLRSGSGMRVKVLDAFARGVPVVSTRLGWEGIDATPGEHLLSADLPDAFAAALLRVLDDPGLAGSLAAAARVRALERYDVTAIAPSLLDAVGAASHG